MEDNLSDILWGEAGACRRLCAGDAARGDDSGEIQFSGRREARRTLLLSQAVQTHCDICIMYAYVVMLTLKVKNHYSKHCQTDHFLPLGSVSINSCS